MKILYLPNEYSQQRQHEKPANIYPVRMAMEAEWYRQQGHEVVWSSEKDMSSFHKIAHDPEGLPFLDLPAPDRIFTNAKSYVSGNYKHTPGTHMQVADGCWHGKCTFCAEKGSEYLVRPVEDVIKELHECKEQGFKEVFDDSGTFPIGKWLTKFCVAKHNSDLRDYPFSCNMRIGANVDYKLLKVSGFRMLLYGVESINQYTLDRLNKGVNANDIIKEIKNASEAGIEPHIAVMFGYPWESSKEELKTLSLVHYLLRKGYAKTAQASIYDGWKGGRIQDGKPQPKDIYKAAYHADFWINKIRDLRNLADVIYLIKGIKEGLK